MQTNLIQFSKRFCVFIFLLLTAFNLKAQHATGCIVDAKLLKIKTLPQFTGLGVDDIPDTYSLRKYCPTPGSQGQIGSCCAWALGYGVMTIKHAIDYNIVDRRVIDQSAFSSLFIFNQIKITNCSVGSGDICGACGSSFTDATDLLQKKGDALHNEYNDYKCAGEDGNNLASEAARFKITGSATLFNTLDTYNKVSDEEKIHKVAVQIANQNPVFFAMSLPSRQGGGTLFEGTENFTNGQWTPPANAVPDQNQSHALTIVGYDMIHQTFDIMNSWDTTWADHGFCKVTYADFLKYANYAGCMFTPKVIHERLDVSRLSLKLEKYKRISGIVTDQGTSVQVDFNGAYYDATVTQGQGFKINLGQLPGDYYVYVMSSDNSGNTKIHFPLQNQSNFVFKNNLSYLVPQNSTLFFNEESANLVILVSRHEIPDFETRFTNAVAAGGNLYQRLQATFGVGNSADPKNFGKDNLSLLVPGYSNQPVLLFVNMKRA